MSYGDEEPAVYPHGGAAGARRGEPGSWWRAVLAELVGSAALLLLGCVGVAGGPRPSPAHGALVFGLVVALVVQTFDHVSGAQLNPAVTLAAVVMGRVPAALGAAFALAQLAGAALGCGLAGRLVPAEAAGACMTLPAAHVSPLQALALEALLGGALALANCACWDARNRLLLDSWPVRIGLVVAALSVAGGPLTGAGMNPARSFAPALWNWHWTDHWVYWAGPLLGALAGAAAYRRVWRPPPPPAPAPAPRAAPSPPPARAALDARDAKDDCTA